MPRSPFMLPGRRAAKKPAWLNDPPNYHDRGNIDFCSCSRTCFEQGDFFGLDDLFTEKPVVLNGLAQIYSSGSRVQARRLPRRHRAACQRRLLPALDPEAARGRPQSRRIADFSIFGEAHAERRHRPLRPTCATAGCRGARLSVPQVASAYASGASGAKGVANRLADDDYFRTANGIDPSFTTFLGNHDMGRAALQILTQAPGLAGPSLVQHVLFGYDLLYLLRGAPAVLYGDEVGMIGSGGDQQARQDMFPTQVPDWQTQQRVGSPPIGKGSSLALTGNPIQSQLRSLGRAPRRASRALDRSLGRALCAERGARRLPGRPGEREGGRRRLQQRGNGSARHGDDGNARRDLEHRLRARSGGGRADADDPRRSPRSPPSRASRCPRQPSGEADARAGKPDALTSALLLCGNRAEAQPASVTLRDPSSRAARGGRVAIDDSAPFRDLPSARHDSPSVRGSMRSQSPAARTARRGLEGRVRHAASLISLDARVDAVETRLVVPQSP